MLRQFMRPMTTDPSLFLHPNYLGFWLWAKRVKSSAKPLEGRTKESGAGRRFKGRRKDAFGDNVVAVNIDVVPGQRTMRIDLGNLEGLWFFSLEVVLR